MQNGLTDWQREMLEALLAGKQLEKISPSGAYPVTKYEAMIRIAENLTSSLRIKREMYRMYSHVGSNKKWLPWTLERQRNDTHYMEFDAETHELVKGCTPL